MVAGIPGTGIGGLFYLLLAMLMPIREACRTCVGRSSFARWGDVGIQFVNASGIIGSVWLTAWLLGQLLRRSGLGMGPGFGMSTTGGAPALISLISATAALITLGVVILLVNLLQFVIPRRKSPPRD